MTNNVFALVLSLAMAGASFWLAPTITTHLVDKAAEADRAERVQRYVATGQNFAALMARKEYTKKQEAMIEYSGPVAAILLGFGTFWLMTRPIGGTTQNEPQNQAQRLTS